MALAVACPFAVIVDRQRDALAPFHFHAGTEGHDIARALIAIDGEAARNAAQAGRDRPGVVEHFPHIADLDVGHQQQALTNREGTRRRAGAGYRRCGC